MTWTSFKQLSDQKSLGGGCDGSKREEMSSPHVTWSGSVLYNYYYCGRFSSTYLGEKGGREKKITVLSGTWGSGFPVSFWSGTSFHS